MGRGSTNTATVNSEEFLLPAKRKDIGYAPFSPEKVSRTPEGPVADWGLAMVDAGNVPPVEARATELMFLHFNDVYEVQARTREPVGGVARFIEKLRQYPEAVTLFSGDALAPSLLSTVTKGEHMVKFLNMMNIDCACMGNHDFDFGVQHLRDFCVPESNFPWLLSNAWHADSGELLAGGKRSLVIERKGRRIGIMGLIEEEWLATLATIERDEVIYRDYVEIAREILAELKEQGVDTVIALTHMRKPNDRRLAAEVPELDVILGGHDHEVFSEVVNGVPIIKSGTDFRDLTKLKFLWKDADVVAGERTRPQVSWEHEEVTEEVAECPKAAALVDLYSCELAKSMEKVLGELGCSIDAKFEHIRSRETNCGNWVADCVRDGVENSGIHVDMVLINSGTLRADDVFPPGPFLMRDLVTLLPMLDELAVLALTGAQVLEALENGVSMYPKLEGRFPCVSGVAFAFSASAPMGARVIRDSVLVNGAPLDMDREYHLVTKAYLAAGRDGYEVFLRGRMVRDGEGSPLLADIIRSQFAAIAHVNSELHLDAGEGEGGARAAGILSYDSSLPKPRTGSPLRGCGSPAGGVGALGSPVRATEIKSVHRSKHISKSHDKSLTASEVVGGAHAIDKTASSADLEGLLKGEEIQHWPLESPAKMHPEFIHGRYQVFAKVDHRLVCRP